jgi:hypothetical protein
MRDKAAALEQLTSDLHDLIFDLQEARTPDSAECNAIEGQRIAAAISQVFDDEIIVR